MLFGCKAIDSIEPNQKETFLKVYGETNETIAKDILVLDDGYLILGSYDSVSVLLKTDLKGNKQWANSFTNFVGNGLAEVNGGYILVGDSINSEAVPSTSMQLIQTDLSGQKVNSVAFLSSTAIAGIAAIFTSDEEIAVLGHKIYSNDVYESTILVGYSSDLVEVWQTEYGGVNTLQVPYHSLFENTNGNLTWASFEVDFNPTKISVHAPFVQPGDQTPVGNTYLFNNQQFNATVGSFVQTPVGFALTQTINIGNEQRIGVTTYNQNTSFDEYVLDTLEFQEGNYFPTAIANTPNGLLISGQTDNFKDSSSEGRTDMDLFVVEVGYNGIPKSSGINNTFGGLGNEQPVRIKNTSDGGYLILGNLTNTKGATQLFLLKLNNKGELN